MKIFSSLQIKSWDQETCKEEGISSLELMERAARACTMKIIKKFSEDEEFLIVCGKGNNGGDGLAIARLLLERKRKLRVFVLDFSKNESEDFTTNFQKLKEIDKSKLIRITEPEEFECKGKNTVVIDCIFGIGIKQNVKGKYAQIIHQINSSGLRVVSVDMPSGLYCDQPFNEKGKSEIIHSDLTLSFQQPKLSFLIADNENYVPAFDIVDIQLLDKFQEKTDSHFYYLEDSDFSAHLKKPSKFDHKGKNGHALLIAGSKGKTGAATIAAKSFLKCGGGLLSLQIPEHANAILQCNVPEAMTQCDANQNYITQKIDYLPYSAIGIGPGLGTEKETARVLKVCIQDCAAPMVLDADALNILSENKTWISFLKPNTILTPHPKEFDRMFGAHTSAYDRIKTATEKSIRFNIIIVLKGAHTSIHVPDGNVFFNSTGNPGMAKGGFGDALTGMILSLLCKGYSPVFSAGLGVYLHGLAADIATKKIPHISLQPEDLIKKIPKAWEKLL